MEYRNLSNFVLSLFCVYLLIVCVPFANRVFVVLGVTLLSIKLAEWLTEITRKYFLYKQVSPKDKVILITALWAVVNNAGTMQCGQVEWSSVEEFQRACDVNTFGALRVTKAFLPFIKQSKGRIVNVTSSGGRYMIPGFSAYCLSKSAAVALITSLQMELRKWDVKCISIEPFLYSTPLVGQGMFAVAKKTWNEAPVNIQEEYGKDYFEAFKTLIDRLLCIFANSNVSQVIDCMEDAITAEDPLPVYIPAKLLYRIILLVYRVLPFGMKEQLAGYILDIKEKPLALRMKKKQY